MNFKHLPISVFVLLLVLNLIGVKAFAQAGAGQPKAPGIEFITAEELKRKISKNERITVIDVRSSSAFSESEDKIKGAIRVKLRKLKSRLAVPPLKKCLTTAKLLRTALAPVMKRAYVQHRFFLKPVSRECELYNTAGRVGYKPRDSWSRDHG